MPRRVARSHGGHATFGYENIFRHYPSVDSIVRHEGEAHTTYANAYRVAWEVTGGELDASDAWRVQWTLPSTPGIYQAELLLDYGADGVAFDALMLEVTATDARSASV